LWIVCAIIVTDPPSQAKAGMSRVGDELNLTPLAVHKDL
jgi:hypothetical protein